MFHNRRKFKLKWRTLLTVVTFIALGALVYALRGQIVSTFKNLENLNLWLLLLTVPLQGLQYHFIALMYRQLFKVLGDKVSYKFLFKTGLELNFVNLVFPSAGLSGFSYFSLRLRTQDVRAGKASLVQTMRFGLVFISFQILLFVGLLLLALDGRANNFMLLIAASIATLLGVITVGFAFVIGNENRIDKTLTFIARVINRLIRLVLRKQPETINLARARLAFGEFHNSYNTLRKNVGELRRPLFYALMISLMEILTIYVVFGAFGFWINPGAVIIAYAVANFAGLISVLPGGIGIYEALMTGVLAAGGVPAALSLPIVVTYRVLSMAIQIPPGGLLYNQAVNGDRK